MVGIDWGNLIIPEIWCYFNVNIPIYSEKLLEKSSVSTGYAGGKVEKIMNLRNIFIDKCFFCAIIIMVISIRGFYT